MTQLIKGNKSTIKKVVYQRGANGYNKDNGDFVFGDPLARLEKMNVAVRVKQLKV